ncbi:hypothetical protein [Cohaesibacter intestini]|uniref:hypothetical protein n=1 Tax=Cohaesibacter intestini TaxID=2211145 RepID=UPI0013004091|nr:hypothetical protein [Cohaesibacter intestini]
MSIGLAASLSGAFFQATNYAFTQKCQQTSGYSSAQILLASHAAMGLIAALPFIGLNAWRYLDPSHFVALIWINLPYAIAQLLIAIAIQKSDVSIVSPLLALKIPTITILMSFMGQPMPAWHQLVAIVAILLMAYLLSRRAGRLDVLPACLVIGASLGYAQSDIEITRYTQDFVGLSALMQVALTVSINYVFCGFFAGLGMLSGCQPLSLVYAARWVALSWFVAVCLLLVGFRLSGVLEANVAQSLRGVFGILLSMLFLNKIVKGQGDWHFKLLMGTGMTIAVFFYFL